VIDSLFVHFLVSTNSTSLTHFVVVL